MQTLPLAFSPIPYYNENQNGGLPLLEKLPQPLLGWYRQNARVLPWRSDPTPYHVWVSEIMLQQTRVAAVLEYYRRFMEALPTLADLAACPEERLMKLWQGLGYYSRARNLQKAATQIMDKHGGVFPPDIQAIRALPGIGDYTAGAIASIAFGQAVPAVDGNVLRVVSRLTDDHREMARPAVKKEVAAALTAVIPQDSPGDFNQALMDLGATVCLPGGAPLCGQCPAADFCAGKRAGTVQDLPVLPAKKPRKIQRRTVYLIFYQGRVALRKRPQRGLLAGLWEYPNALSPWDCPVKGSVTPAGNARHIFTHMEWHMDGYAVEAASGTLPEGWVWAGPEDLARLYAVPGAFDGFAPVVDEHLKHNRNEEAS